jgi:hypothetical protein
MNGGDDHLEHGTVPATSTPPISWDAVTLRAPQSRMTRPACLSLLLTYLAAAIAAVVADG